MNRPELHLFHPARRIGVILLFAAALALHACGGGVEGQGTGSVSYSEGPIGGFGSVIVNGVHFDDSLARIVDTDGNTLRSDDLKLGMTVQIDAGAIDPTALTAVAKTITVGSDLLDPVSANDAGTSTLTVLGQPVRVTASTSSTTGWPVARPRWRWAAWSRCSPSTTRSRVSTWPAASSPKRHRPATASGAR